MAAILNLHNPFLWWIWQWQGTISPNYYFCFPKHCPFEPQLLLHATTRLHGEKGEDKVTLAGRWCSPYSPAHLLLKNNKKNLNLPASWPRNLPSSQPQAHSSTSIAKLGSAESKFCSELEVKYAKKPKQRPKYISKIHKTPRVKYTKPPKQRPKYICHNTTCASWVRKLSQKGNIKTS